MPLFLFALIFLAACHKPLSLDALPEVQSGGTPGENVPTIDRLLLAGPDTASVSTCEPFEVISADATGPLKTQTQIPIGLSVSGTGSFYEDASCVVAISATKIPAGQLSREFYFASSDGQSLVFTATSPGLAGAQKSVSILGEASLLISDGPTYDFGFVATGATQTKYLSVTNFGSGEATGLVATALQAPFRFLGGAYPGTGASCGSELGAGSSCTLAVQFAPMANGTFQDSLRLTYSDGQGAVTSLRDLQGRSIDSGALDSNFGSNGIFAIAFSENAGASDNDYGYSAAIQTDGKILVAGQAYVNGSFDFAIARVLPNGTLDTTFGTEGKRTVDFGATDTVRSVALQADGKIVLGGSAIVSGLNRFALARFQSNGTLDTTFATQGIVTTSFARSAAAYSLAVQPDQKIILAGTLSQAGGASRYAVARYLTNGSLDTSFGTAGQMAFGFSGYTNATANDVQVSTTGDILLGGMSYTGAQSAFAGARLTSNGSLDSSFSTTGSFTASLSNSDSAYAAGSDGMGGWLLAGTTDASGVGDMAVLRFHSNGALDSGFGVSGHKTLDFGSTSDVANAIAIDTQGRILLGGAGSIFALARLHSDGTLDTSFGGTGQVSTDALSSHSQIYAAKIQSDAKILVLGKAFNGTNYDFVLARYWP